MQATTVAVVGGQRLAAFALPTSIYRRLVKRPVDVAFSATLLVVLLPLFLLIVVAIRVFLGPGSPIIFQERVGLDGRVFRLAKFRSMLRDRRVRQLPFVGEDRRRCHKTDGDPRHRPFGRLLRSLSIDELPQLWNVLGGDMSLVGPRPELVSVARTHGMVDHPRHLVRPGITGPYQVSPERRSGDLRTGLTLDIGYLRAPGFATDARILARTLVAVVRRTGT